MAGAGTRVAQRVGTVAAQVGPDLGRELSLHFDPQTPELIGQGSRLAGSLIKAANDTAPLIIQVVLDNLKGFKCCLCK